MSLVLYFSFQWFVAIPKSSYLPGCSSFYVSGNFIFSNSLLLHEGLFFFFKSCVLWILDRNLWKDICISFKVSLLNAISLPFPSLPFPSLPSYERLVIFNMWYNKLIYFFFCLSLWKAHNKLFCRLKSPWNWSTRRTQNFEAVKIQWDKKTLQYANAYVLI